MTILPPEQHPTASKPRFTRGKSAEKTKEKEPVKPHVKASLEDINWVRSQPPCVQQLWLDCVAVEQFGGQQRKLETSLSKNFFPKAKSALEARGLFKFERTYTTSDAGRAVATGWKVENLHGYYYKKYWELSSHDSATSPSKRDDTARKKGQDSTKRGMTSPSKSDDISRKEGEETPETCSMTDAAENQPLFNQLSTTPQPPTKVVEEGSCISQETQQTPLGGAAATSGEMQEEKLPTAAEVASLGGADVLTPQSPSVEVQADVASDEPTHLGGGESSGGSDITTKLNSYVVEAVDCDRGSLGESELKTNCSQAVVEVGHADIVARICGQAAIHYYEPTKEQTEQMMELTVRQLDVVSQRFQQQMSQRLTYPNRAKTKLSFEFALGLAKRSAPV